METREQGWPVELSSLYSNTVQFIIRKHKVSFIIFVIENKLTQHYFPKGVNFRLLDNSTLAIDKSGVSS